MNRADRLPFLLECANDLGILVQVSQDTADSFIREWGAIVRRVLTRPVRRSYLPSRKEPKVSACPSRPGVWIQVKGHSAECHVYQVIVVVPPGVGIFDVLTVDQFAKLDRHVLPGPSLRYHRVVLGVPGSRETFRCYRTMILGELAEAIIVPAPSRVDVVIGSKVTWAWHSKFGTMHHFGIVLASVPAGQEIHEILPDVKIRWGFSEISNQDRYIVRLNEGRKCRIMTPPAHLVHPLSERPCGSSISLSPS